MAQQHGGIPWEHGEIAAWCDGIGAEYDAVAQEHDAPRCKLGEVVS